MRSFAPLSLLLAVAGIAVSQTINPDTVPQATRDSWCRDQKSSCPLLCLQTSTSETTKSNTCDSKTLAWTCVCGNGLTPNVTQYSLTIPFYECQEYGNQCVKACGQDNTCSDNCRTKNLCGAQSPNPVNTTTATTSSTAAGSSSTGSGSSGTFGGSGTGSSSSSGANSMLQLGQSYGIGILLASVFAGATLML